MDKEQFKEVYRHSLAHIMAKAVIELFGKESVQLAIGPQIADGCYYDFLLPRAVTADDYKTIENKMREIIKRREDWTCLELSRAEALELFRNQKYKVELIEDLPEDEKIRRSLQRPSCEQFPGAYERCLPGQIRLQRVLERRREARHAPEDLSLRI